MYERKLPEKNGTTTEKKPASKTTKYERKKPAPTQRKQVVEAKEPTSPARQATSVDRPIQRRSNVPPPVEIPPIVLEPASFDPDEKKSERTTKIAWTSLLLVYSFLFCVTGCITFFGEDFDPFDQFNQEMIRRVENADETVRPTLIDMMKQSANAKGDQQELASQSFNVVLGALLGFLSATATTINRSRSGKK